MGRPTAAQVAATADLIEADEGFAASRRRHRMSRDYAEWLAREVHRSLQRGEEPPMRRVHVDKAPWWAHCDPFKGV